MLNNIITNNVMSVVTIYSPYLSGLSPNEIIKGLTVTTLIIYCILAILIFIKNGDGGALVLVIPFILFYLLTTNGVDKIELKGENAINQIDKIYESQ